jgi:hypothetical protein
MIWVLVRRGVFGEGGRESKVMPPVFFGWSFPYELTMIAFARIVRFSLGGRYIE